MGTGIYQENVFVTISLDIKLEIKFKVALGRYV